MIKAKLTSKGQITIPVEIRRMLDLQAGDHVSFELSNEGSGVLMNKSNRPLTIQERFENYNIQENKKAVSKAMKEVDTGEEKGEEKY